jgi:hypothetical protein
VTSGTTADARSGAIAAPQAGLAPGWQNPAAMESKARRTLVKSPPELWELADDVERLEAWMADLVGTSHPIPVLVTDRQPERALAWQAAGDEGRGARIALELAEKGFGTSVSITAEHQRHDPDGAEALLEQLLDELGSPERRPFARA